VENAVQAMLDTDSYPKRLTVLTQLINDRVKITIIDTGPGIPAGLLEQIKKGKPIEKEKGSKGAGVGLALARTIFGAYQGDITIQETSSSGTTVVITLPVES
jgi:signal transduction histidine kinase